MVINRGALACFRCFLHSAKSLVQRSGSNEMDVQQRNIFEKKKNGEKVGIRTLLYTRQQNVYAVLALRFKKKEVGRRIFFEIEVVSDLYFYMYCT